MNSKASDWFTDKQLFIETTKTAYRNAVSKGHEPSVEFASQMANRAGHHGLNLYISEKQMKWLCQLADIVMPLHKTQREKRK